MSKPRILVQLDSDPQPSVFDAVVAVDAGVDQLLQYGAVRSEQIQGLVHGAMFTRGPKDLKYSAVFVGGSDVPLGETMLRAVTDSFFGPVRVSVMMDASGANTTSAAAVVAAGRHLQLHGLCALVLGATGPVGQRVVRLLAAAESDVRVASRSRDRATEVSSRIQASVEGASVSPAEIRTNDDLLSALAEVDLVVSAGAAGVELLPEVILRHSSVKVAIDLNAVPPAGIGGIDSLDQGKDLDGQIVYGAVGVGGTKMKIHKAAVQRLFASNDCVLDIDEIYSLGVQLERERTGSH